MTQTKWTRWMSQLSAKQLFGLAILVLYILIALLAPMLMTHDPWEINRTEREPPDTRPWACWINS